MKTGVSLREFDRSADASAVQKLDTSFTSDFSYDVRLLKSSIELHVVPSDPPFQKRFPFNLDDPIFDRGYVAIDKGLVKGFIAANYEAWNRRLKIWHFYVDPSHRKRGLGRLLMAAVIQSGRNSGALTAWAETSNLNHPGIEAYKRLGFSVCGFDTTLYRGTPSENEFAVFLSANIAC